MCSKPAPATPAAPRSSQADPNIPPAPAPSVPQAAEKPACLTAPVTNVQRYSLHDGGGIRTTVFLKGCPFKCPWCCNPENLSSTPEVSFKESLCMGCTPKAPGERLCSTPPELCPTGAKTLLGVPRTPEDMAQEVLRDAVLFEESNGGVTASGGEALLWADWLVAFFGRIKKAAMKTALETTLAVKAPRLQDLAIVCDLWLVDFKIADQQRSLDLIGVDPQIRDAQLQELLASGTRVVARMPIIPRFTDDPANVAANLDRIRELGIGRVDILPFHQLGSGKYDAVGRSYGLGDLAALTDDQVAWIVEEASKSGLNATLHGE